MTQPVRIAILFSARGSNMQRLAHHLAKPSVGGEFVLAITNRPAAGGIEFCKAQGILCAVIDHEDYETRAGFEAEMQKALDKAQVDLICAAGFMRLLTADFVTRWHDRIINIHPSLLPAYKGLNTHARVLADGGREHGCSVHYMRAEMDDGPIIVQKRVPILCEDTADTLAARVLKQEHIAYPEAIDIVIKNFSKS